MESSKTPIDCENVTITLSQRELNLLISTFNPDLYISGSLTALNLYNKLLFLKSGDACRHSVQSPDVVGQGGIIHDCRNTSDCLCLKCVEALGLLGGNYESFPRVDLLGVSTLKSLQANNIKTIHELVSKTAVDLLRLPNFGKRRLTEVKVYLERLGLCLTEGNL